MRSASAGRVSDEQCCRAPTAHAPAGGSRRYPEAEPLRVAGEAEAARGMALPRLPDRHRSKFLPPSMSSNRAWRRVAVRSGDPGSSSCCEVFSASRATFTESAYLPLPLKKGGAFERDIEPQTAHLRIVRILLQQLIESGAGCVHCSLRDGEIHVGAHGQPPARQRETREDEPSRAPVGVGWKRSGERFGTVEVCTRERHLREARGAVVRLHLREATQALRSLRAARPGAHPGPAPAGRDSAGPHRRCRA